MRTDETGNSARLAMWYRDAPLSLEMMKILEGEVTNECWKYLFGKYCLSEKKNRLKDESINEIYQRIGEEFGFAYTNMKDYIDYAHAIDRIHSLMPHISEEILNGGSRIGQKATIMFARLDFREMGEVMTRLSREKTPVKLIIAEQKARRTKTKRLGVPQMIKTETPRASVKDNPVYDPDAQINGLSFTMPSWVNMIERAFTISNFTDVSQSARDRLAGEFKKLTAAADTMTALLSEGK